MRPRTGEFGRSWRSRTGSEVAQVVDGERVVIAVGRSPGGDGANRMRVIVDGWNVANFSEQRASAPRTPARQFSGTRWQAAHRSARATIGRHGNGNFHSGAILRHPPGAHLNSWALGTSCRCRPGNAACRSSAAGTGHCGSPHREFRHQLGSFPNTPTICRVRTDISPSAALDIRLQRAPRLPWTR